MQDIIKKNLNKLLMKYLQTVYEEWEAFYISAVNEAQEKVTTFDALQRISMKEILANTQSLQFVSELLKLVGWNAYFVIAGLVGMGYLTFFGGMGALIAVNPFLAAAVVVVAGASAMIPIIKIWEHRKVVTEIKKVGKSYKLLFDEILLKSKSVSDREKLINELHHKCSTDIVKAVFNLSMQYPELS